ncbi:MAG: class I SAM-dependent methyltransferase [Sedimentibacter sp.]|uniref:tRNA (mnm(5)s(2)U34)-methyltransferase n=1 Tax=Sedimentibacter sp. TaxID=1960295 RepID=UPI0031583462
MDNAKYGKIVDFVHMLIKTSYNGKENLQFVDATCGNGFDTLFLSNTAGPGGSVKSFDIQPQAIDRTQSLLSANKKYDNFNVIMDSHEFIGKYVSGKIDAAVFNLGYLPYSDKTVTTDPETTVRAIGNLLPQLGDDGRIYITSYVTHDVGHEIKDVMDFLCSLDKKEYNVIHIRITNKDNNPPELFIVEKNA